MTVFYHMIGDKLWTRDGPRSIGIPGGATRAFQYVDIELHLSVLDPVEQELIREKTMNLAPDGFQVWGVPRGALRVMRNMTSNDIMLLGGTERFDYAGEVIHPVSIECWDLSRHIWGEQSYPLIVLLRGRMIDYPWADFVTDFNYKATYKPGRYRRVETIGKQAMEGSVYGSDAAFVAKLLSGTDASPQKATALTTGFSADEADPEPFDPTSVEDARERIFRAIITRRGQEGFRNALIGAYEGCCAITGCDLLDILEAAHITPYLGPETNHVTNGLLLRADLHTLFDVNLLAVDPDTATVLVAPSITDPTYRALHGRPLRQTTTKASAPSVVAVQQHRSDCRW